MLIAALKYRFNECEKKGFSFKGLNKPTVNSKPHNIIPTATRNLIDNKLEHNLPMRIACRLLYELAGRC
jgi:hypothetical protein